MEQVYFKETLRCWDFPLMLSQDWAAPYHMIASSKPQ